MILWIAYEAASAANDARDDVHNAIREAAGARNVHRAMPNVWLVDSDESASAWVDTVEPALKKGDRVIVTKLQRGAAAMNITPATDWLKVHRESF
jgi:hypothetical protein